MSRDAASEKLDIEVVFATAERQELIQLSVPRGTTAGAAIDLSGMRDRFPGLIDPPAGIGVWGHVTGPDRVLKDGDRVEIYRDLLLNPREARRILAEQGRSMNQGSLSASTERADGPTGSGSAPDRPRSR